MRPSIEQWPGTKLFNDPGACIRSSVEGQVWLLTGDSLQVTPYTTMQWLLTGAALSPVVLRAGFPDQQHQYHLGTCLRCRFFFFLISRLIQFYCKILQPKALYNFSRNMLQDVKYQLKVQFQNKADFFFLFPARKKKKLLFIKKI